MITFLGMPSRSSGEIRGRQVAQAIPGNLYGGHGGARFADVHNPDWKAIAQNEVVVFVRTWDGNLAKELKRRGYAVGYDVLDQMVGDAVHRGVDVKDLRAYAHAECDFFIVNNTVTSRDLASHTSEEKPIYVVPHHTVNYGRHVNPVRDRVERVGYIGLPEQLSAKDDITMLCEKHGAEFVSIHPSTREECDAVLRTIDVGVVFAEADGRIKPAVADLMRRYKPATKLTNFMSYGIPTVCTPYESYIEFGDKACEFANSKEDMLALLEMFLGGRGSRRWHSERSAWVAERFHIDEIAKKYAAIAADVLARRNA